MNPYSPSSTAHYGSPTGSLSSSAIHAVVDQLVKTKPWVRFMSVLILVGAGFLLLSAFAMVVVGVTAGNNARPGPLSAAGGLGLGALYFILAVIYIFPGVKLWKYASRIADLARSHGERDLVAALAEQRMFWRFVGMTVVAMMILYFLAFIVMIVGFAASRR